MLNMLFFMKHVLKHVLLVGFIVLYLRLVDLLGDKGLVIWTLFTCHDRFASWIDLGLELELSLKGVFQVLLFGQLLFLDLAIIFH